MALAGKISKPLAKVDDSHMLPDYLKGHHETGLEGFDAGDFKMPWLKLLQALSPEVNDFPGIAKPGDFWVSNAKLSLGNEFSFIPAVASRRVTLWKPRADGGGILATARDGVHWDKPNHTFDVTIRKNQKVTWNTRNTVQESRLLEWGSSNPTDKDSEPAARLSYDFIAYLLPTGEHSPILFSLYRTGINIGRDFLSQLRAARKPIQAIRVQASSRATSAAEGDYYSWQFRLIGHASEVEFSTARALYEEYKSYDVSVAEVAADDKAELPDNLAF